MSVRPLACAVIVAAVGWSLAGAGLARPGQPPFRGTIAPISGAMRAAMTSWRPGCPVRVAELRLLTLTYWGFDHRAHAGELVVHRRVATAVLHAMRSVFAARFPIRRMRPVEAYGSDDERSMAADNTSAFNCRRVTGSSSWSEHARGLAIDINPLENPEIRGARVLPPAGAAFTDRSRWKPGMIHVGDAVVRAFAGIGWRWGGYWRSPKDYQHFSSTGR
jgi:hypothetical protein